MFWALILFESHSLLPFLPPLLLVASLYVIPSWVVSIGPRLHPAAVRAELLRISDGVVDFLATATLPDPSGIAFFKHAFKLRI